MRATAGRPRRCALRAPPARAHAAVRASAGALPGLHRA
ncbi:TPA: transposase, partial [Pseudomonas aeruginosa]|nr:transposase [Pseudomonas aeruginosa]